MSRYEDAALYAEDEHGRRIPRVHKHCIGYGVMPVKETPRHALSNANTEATEEQQELERREREARWKFDALSSEDRELLRLYLLVRPTSRERKVPFPAAQRADREAGGWLFVKYTGPGNRSALMVRRSDGRLTQDEIAERLGLSIHQVRRRLSALDASMVRAAERLGWT